MPSPKRRLGEHLFGPHEMLVGDLKGACSSRINIQHRLVHQIMDEIKTVKVIRMFTHCE